MKTLWIERPIVRDGETVSPGLDSKNITTADLGEVAHKIQLIKWARGMDTCDGRLMAQEEFDRLESYDTRLESKKMNDSLLRQLVEEFWDDYSFMMEPEGDGIPIEL